MNAIAEASSQQNSGITQITTAIHEIDHVTQTNAASAEETTASAHEVETRAAALREAVDELQSIVFGEKRSPRQNASLSVVQPAAVSPEPEPAEIS